MENAIFCRTAFMPSVLINNHLTRCRGTNGSDIPKLKEETEGDTTSTRPETSKESEWCSALPLIVLPRLIFGL